MQLSPRFKKVVNFILGPLLFVLIAISIYRQVNQQANIHNSWQAIKQQLAAMGIWWIVLAVVLMVCNWALESEKWRRLASVAAPISFATAFKSVLSGISVTMLTPNRVGEFLGRVLYLPDGSRVRSAFLTFLGSLSQLIATMFFGLLGLLYINKHYLQQTEWHPLLVNVLLYGTLFALVATFILLFNIGWVTRALEKLPKLSKYVEYIHLIGDIGPVMLIKLLLLSMLRYSVFIAQYLLVFYVLQLPLSIPEMLAGTAVMFLLLAAIPTIALAELGVRGKVSLFVFGLFSSDILGILVASGIIWILNIVMPALAGSLLLLRIKVFKRSNS